MRVNPPIHRSFKGLDLKYVWPGGLLLKEAMDVAIEIKNRTWVAVGSSDRPELSTSAVVQGGASTRSD